jgi:hypothetical protein
MKHKVYRPGPFAGGKLKGGTDGTKELEVPKNRERIGDAELVRAFSASMGDARGGAACSGPAGIERFDMASKECGLFRERPT